MFFSVELNRQGPDVGTQYRSAVFFANPEQQQATTAFITKLTKDKTFSRPIVTQVASLASFYEAERYHQNYLVSHTTQPYIVYNDLPKLDDLQKRYPALWTDSRANRLCAAAGICRIGADNSNCSVSVCIPGDELWKGDDGGSGS